MKRAFGWADWPSLPARQWTVVPLRGLRILHMPDPAKNAMAGCQRYFASVSCSSMSATNCLTPKISSIAGARDPTRGRSAACGVRTPGHLQRRDAASAGLRTAARSDRLCAATALDPSRSEHAADCADCAGIFRGERRPRGWPSNSFVIDQDNSGGPSSYGPRRQHPRESPHNVGVPDYGAQQHWI